LGGIVNRSRLNTDVVNDWVLDERDFEVHPFAVDLLLNAALNFVEQNCCVSGVNCGGKEKVDGGVRDMVGRQEQQNN